MRCGARVYFGIRGLVSLMPLWPFRRRNREDSSRIQSDESLLFFPTAARWSAEEQSWEIPIHGWIYAPRARSLSRWLAIRRLRSTLGIVRQTPEYERFERRVRWFFLDNKRGKSLSIRIAGQVVTLAHSDADGHCAGVVSLAGSLASQHVAENRLPFKTVVPASDARSFGGLVHLCPEQGVSIVSDIDDTIKISDVCDKKLLLRRTFVEPLLAVPGMAARYRQWAARGVQFHYVSASPWQFYDPLASFLREEGFPDGTFHLKLFRPRDSSAMRLFADQAAYKESVIRELVQSYPDRKFVLIGDSGEKDPEAYGSIARRFPRQIARILIRDLSGEQREAQRFRIAFEGVRDDVWRLFRAADELAGVLPAE
jgi:hypothetical protein